MRAVADLLKQGKKVVNLLPDEMQEVTRLDAIYHAEEKDAWIEKNQLLAARNIRFHQQVIREVSKDLNDGSVILELGGGVGFDADLFLQEAPPFECYVLSEISPAMLEYALSANLSLQNKRVVLCCLDANDIRLCDEQVDVVFAIAALHHFPRLPRAVAEIDRITKPNARIVFGVEPNSRWTRLVVRLRPLYRGLLPGKSHSAADEEAEGFRIDDFRSMADATGWRIAKITPVWFVTGFLHYGLEFIFRALRLRKRLRIPSFLESVFLTLDRLFFLLPYTDRLAWHYTVVFEKAPGMVGVK